METLIIDKDTPQVVVTGLCELAAKYIKIK